jgi:hypothetical protein
MSEQLVRGSDVHNKTANPLEANFFNGFTNHGSSTYDPYVSGFAFIKWLKLPVWVDGNKSPLTPHNLASLSQKNFKKFSGLANIEMETGGITAGFTANELHYAKGIGQKPTEFTLTYQEHSGSPLTRYYNHWVSGIRDPKSGIATYPKEYRLPYHSSNHTGTLVYVVTRPDADNYAGLENKSNLEFACILTHVQPKRINLEHFNFENGAHELFEVEQPFTAYMHIGQTVETYVDKRMAQWFYEFVNEGSFSNLVKNDFVPS